MYGALPCFPLGSVYENVGCDFSSIVDATVDLSDDIFSDARSIGSASQRRKSLHISIHEPRGIELPSKKAHFLARVLFFLGVLLGRETGKSPTAPETGRSPNNLSGQLSK